MSLQTDLKKLLLEAYGQASTLNMLDLGDDHSAAKEEIQATIDTGKQLQATILHALKIVHDMGK